MAKFRASREFVSQVVEHGLFQKAIMDSDYLEFYSAWTADIARDNELHWYRNKFI